MKKIKSALNYKTIGFLLLFAVIGAVGCSNSEANTQNEEEKGIPVNVVKLEKEQVSLPIQVSGDISTTKESRLSFKTGGIIESINVDQGDKVRKGEVLAKLDLKEIQEQVNQALIGLEKAQRDYNRVYSLYTDTVATLEQLQNAKSALGIASANLNIAKYNLKFSSIVAPSEGIILKKFFEEDEIVGTGHPIFYFASAEEAWRLVVGISDKDIVKLKLGDNAKITTDAYPNKELECKVSNIANSPGQFTGLYEVELSLEDKDIELKHGFFAKGEIYPSQFNECYALPINAIQEGIGKMVVFYSVNAEGTIAIKQETQIVSMNHEKVFISKNNLHDDMMIIVENQKEIKHLDKVRIIDSEWLAVTKK
ncbi:MAG: efflux RND transporter periplasmic adaptor subunit [Bacteroidales bacterium]|jgi:multidrug efflux system membrane fusion protein|nr:efflux RND transporter periplasmic adaptor subunit [Bacteroidales bacterium]